MGGPAGTKVRLELVNPERKETNTVELVATEIPDFKLVAAIKGLMRMSPAIIDRLLLAVDGSNLPSLPIVARAKRLVRKIAAPASVNWRLRM